MNTYVAFGIFGIISNFAAAWADVTSKRFKVSFWLSFLGQPGSYITMWLLADLISQGNEALALALKINTFIGCYTGLLCHVAFCMKPLLYQRNAALRLSAHLV